MAPNLVNYSSSEEESEVNKCSEPKKPRLPLPKSIIDLKVNGDSTARNDETEDSSLHSGRIRSFKHVRGNWASYVYVQIEYSSIIESLQSQIFDLLINDITDLHKIEENLHISLTKTLILKHHWIDAFVESIRKYTNDMKSFSLDIDAVNVYCNEEKTRTFIGLTISKHFVKPLEMLVRKLDETAKEFKLPVFYEDPSFHMSLMWCLMNQKSNIKRHLSNLQSTLDRYRLDDRSDFHIIVKEIKCKIGDKLFIFPLH